MTQEIGCPLDGTSGSKPVIEENGFTGRQCDTCGLIYISPRPSRQEMAELYAQGNAYLSPEFFIANANSWTGRLTARRDVRLVGRFAPGGALLELGPGAGRFLMEARRRGFDVYGVELNPQQAAFIRDDLQIPCVTSLTEACNLRSSPFDVVYHRDVLSHFYDPLEEMRAIAELLRPTGLHVFETGNGADIDHRHFARIGAFQYPDHLFLYGERSIQRLLELSGFEHIKTYRYSRLPEQLLRSQIWRVTKRGEAGGNHARGADTPGRPEVPSRSGRAARDALDLSYFALRVTVGRMLKRKTDPQTMIVVARKAA